MKAVRMRRIIDDEGADAVVAAALEFAKEQGYRVVVAVVDPSGDLVHLRRTENAQIASSRVAVDKARTAAIFVRPSRDLEAQVTGGVPLLVDGEVVGAIGTSGETPDEDESVSIAGASVAFSTKSVPGLTFEGARIAAEAAGAEAADRGVVPVAAVVDAGGSLIYLHRPD